MPSSYKSSVQSMSPVSPNRTDLANALDVLNASIDSGLVRQMIHEVSPSRRQPPPSEENSSAVLVKCRAVIEDLQEELEEERRRALELQGVIESLHREMEKDRQKHREERMSLDKSKSERASMEKQIRDLTVLVEQKDAELENLTKYCEKKMESLKRTVKEASSSAHSTPPLPAPVVNSSSSHEYEIIMITELKQQLSASSQVIRDRDSEMKSLVESYENQVHMLRTQLRSNEELIDRFVRARDRHAPAAKAAVVPVEEPVDHTEWKAFLNDEYSKLPKPAGSKHSNPFSFYN